jgi:hypothetical protein
MKFVNPRQRIGLILAMLLVLITPLQSSARTIDLHAYWDDRCAECHGHSAAFARRFLTVKDGRLQGRHHVHDLQRFLMNHYLPPDMVAPVTAMLMAQVTTEPRFEKQCGRCHDTAAALARKALTLRDGVLINRATGKPTAEFLKGHQGLSAAEVPFFVGVLMRVTREVEGR